MWATRHIARRKCEVFFPKVPTKQRPRWDNRNRRTYTPDATAEAEKVIKDAWKEQVGEGWKDFGGEVRMLVLIERPLAKSNAKYRAGSADLMAPDCDNTGKLCGDSLNGLAYADDRQITRLYVIKLPRVPFLRFGEGNRCRIRIRIDYYQESYQKG